MAMIEQEKNSPATSSANRMDYLMNYSYESVVVVAKRARQIISHRKEDFEHELEKMGIISEGGEGLINTSGWRKVLARMYEQKDSPVALAKKELETGKLIYQYVT